MLRSLLIGSGVILMLAGCANEQPAKPEPFLELTGRVVDAADIFEPSFEAALTETLAELEEDTLVQLVVATTPSLNGYDIADYSLQLARSWGLGDANRHDGLLLLVAPNERKVRIEVGYGLEASVKDEEASEIIREEMLPEFELGNFEAGVEAGVAVLVQEVTPVELKEAA